jgi:N-acyl-D-aspartate/D-glutamate deacylase
MLDKVIRGGTVIDGTGSPSSVADIGIKDGRIVAIGVIDQGAAEVIDATGCIVTPGFVDPHTHYDAQLLWDPTASPSSVHGVTTIIGGNCGFTLAPLIPGDADYLRKMMSKVEGMPLAALENGTDWSWETFAEYLGRLEGNISVNAGFLVGHCAIRRYVMGPAAVGAEASEAHIDGMRAELAKSIKSGAFGHRMDVTIDDITIVENQLLSIDVLQRNHTSILAHNRFSTRPLISTILYKFIELVKIIRCNCFRAGKVHCDFKRNTNFCYTKIWVRCNN